MLFTVNFIFYLQLDPYGNLRKFTMSYPKED
jgi:hypothetical protein